MIITKNQILNENLNISLKNNFKSNLEDKINFEINLDLYIRLITILNDDLYSELKIAINQVHFDELGEKFQILETF